MTLLIVDDHPLFRKGIKLVVGTAIPDLIIYEASNGLEALELIKNEQINLVLLDLSMPVMDGFEFLNKMKSDRLNCKIIVISLYDEPLVIQKLLDLGVDGYISKNCDVEKIIKAVAAVQTGKIFVESDVDQKLSRLVRDKRISAMISYKEILLIRNLARGKTSKEIANILGYTVRTVETKRRRLEKKLYAKNTPEIIDAAYRYGLLQTGIAND
jgi:DNA-binding NarL/FixJ family response regulator